MSTVNYLRIRYFGSKVPSSHATQTANMVNAQIAMTDGDTVATISHNFLSSTVYPARNSLSDLALGFPLVDWIITSAPTTSIANPLQVFVGTNAVSITKVAQVGSAFTGLFTVQRPQTATR